MKHLVRCLGGPGFCKLRAPGACAALLTLLLGLACERAPVPITANVVLLWDVIPADARTVLLLHQGAWRHKDARVLLDLLPHRIDGVRDLAHRCAIDWDEDVHALAVIDMPAGPLAVVQADGLFRPQCHKQLGTPAGVIAGRDVWAMKTSGGTSWAAPIATLGLVVAQSKEVLRHTLTANPSLLRTHAVHAATHDVWLAGRVGQVADKRGPDLVIGTITLGNPHVIDGRVRAADATDAASLAARVRAEIPQVSAMAQSLSLGHVVERAKINASGRWLTFSTKISPRELRDAIVAVDKRRDGLDTPAADL